MPFVDTPYFIWIKPEKYIWNCIIWHLVSCLLQCDILFSLQLDNSEMLIRKYTYRKIARGHEPVRPVEIELWNYPAMIFTRLFRTNRLLKAAPAQEHIVCVEKRLVIQWKTNNRPQYKGQRRKNVKDTWILWDLEPSDYILLWLIGNWCKSASNRTGTGMGSIYRRKQIHRKMKKIAAIIMTNGNSN